jgi:hypothetical protein
MPRLSPNQSKLQLALLLLASLILFAGCATTPSHHASIGGDKLKKIPGEIRILILPMDIELYEISVGGVPEFKTEWTESGKNNVKAVTKNYFQSRKLGHVFYQQAEVEKESHTQFFRLMNEVGNAMLFHYQTPNLKLPAKKSLDWSVGNISSVLKEEYDADYALYIHLKDHYSSGGRVALGVIMALAGVGIGGGVEVGWSYLVDLESGQVVWFDFIRSHSFGDIREKDGAKEAVNALLTGFPK